MSFNPALHPHAPAGTPAGGQFTTGGSQQKQQPAKAAPKKGAKKATAKKSAKPESLQAIAAKRAAGKPLTPAEKHLWHLNHVNVMKRKAAMAAAAKAKPKTTAKPAAKPAAKKLPSTATNGQKAKAMATIRSGR